MSLVSPLCQSATCDCLQPPVTHAFRCEVCPKSFATAAAREGHTAAIHMGPSGRHFHCGFCNNKSFKLERELEQHFEDCHPSRDIGTTPLPKALICPQCSARYQSENCLKQHIQMTHPGEGSNNSLRSNQLWEGALESSVYSVFGVRVNFE